MKPSAASAKTSATTWAKRRGRSARMETVAVGKKRKKSTHQRNKEQQDELHEKIRVLEAEVANLRAMNDARGVFDRYGARKKIEAVEKTNAELLETIQDHRLSIAAVQSMVPNWLGDANPLSSYIALGRERREREQVLQSIKQQKLAMAYRYCMARSENLDPLRQHSSDERFESAHGDFCCSRFEVVQFPGVSSIEQVYDALRFVRDNLEIIISESLGHITVREDYDCGQDPYTAIANYRLISDDQDGVTLEFNEVSFSQLFRDDEDNMCGVVAIDFVDQDELNPYNSQQRVRKDVSVGIVLTTGVKDPEQEDEEEQIPVVVLRRAVFLRVRRAECGVDKQTLRRVRDATARWGELMLDAMRRIVYHSSDEQAAGPVADHAAA